MNKNNRHSKRKKMFTIHSQKSPEPTPQLITDEDGSNSNAPLHNDRKQQLGGDAIIQGILNEANDEASRLISKAEKSAFSLEKSWQVQHERLKAESILEAQKKKDEVLQDGRSQLAINEKRRLLQLSEQLQSEIIEQALHTAEKLIPHVNYPGILVDLITEAALGIQTTQAEVAASALEVPLITSSMLRAAEARVKEISGRSIELFPSDGQPLPGQGVVLTSLNGTVDISNQIRVRLIRFQSEIRHLIHKELLSDKSSKQQSETAEKGVKGHE